jgi:hypothetical protein
MLHITNGESAGNGIQHTGIPGEVLTWDDVLHEGPVPAGLSLEQMSAVRARFIAEYYSLSHTEVMRDFRRRDGVLEGFRKRDEVVLWFEHDLYDQLQLIQLLDWFARRKLGGTRLSLICIDSFPGIERFAGLGQLTPAQLASLFDTRQEVSQAMLQLSGEAWKAFCAPNPGELETLRGTDTSLPFLDRALLRHMEEFPATENGLSRTDEQILKIVVAGIQKPAEIFPAAMGKEESPFMGDTTIWMHLAQLCRGARPLLKCVDGVAFMLPEREKSHESFLEQELILTEDGEAVLNGQADWVVLSGGIERWLGGVHLQGDDAAWRWDGRQHRLVGRSENSV